MVLIVRNFLIFFLVIFHFFPSFAWSDLDPQDKAAMIIKFTDFIEWPDDAFKNRYFTIGVSGDEKIYDILKNKNIKTLKGRKFRVIKIDGSKQPQAINILYISKNHFKYWDKISKNYNKKFLLTISDKNDFLKKGGIIQFIKKKTGSIGFSINRTTQLESKLSFSSYLLIIAKIVEYEVNSKND